MKKFSMYGFMLVVFCLVLVSCGNLFSKVQIKAKPSIYAPLGKTSFEMSTYISVEKIEEVLGVGKEGADSPFKVYNYNSDKDGAWAFRLYYPLMDLDLDFGKYLKGVDLTGFEDDIPKIDFTVPKFSTTPLTQTIKGPSAPEGVGRSFLVENQTLTIDDMSITIPGEGFRNVTFSDGNAMYMTINPSPSTLTCEPEIYVVLPSLSGSKSVEFKKDTVDPARYKADFSKESIVPGELKFEGSLTLNGEISGDSNITITITPDLGHGFESATVEVPEDTTFDHTVSFEFPDEVKKMIESINFPAEGLGFDLTLNSTLPEGNAVGISLNAFGEDLQETKNDNVLSFRKTGAYGLKPEEPLSATIKVTPPNYDSASNTMTINNVAPGASYSLSGEAKIIADWESVKIKQVDATFGGSFPATDAEPIDLSKFTELLPEEIAFKDIGAALFISSPLQQDDSGTKLSFTGEVSISGEKDNSNSITLVSKDKPLELVSPVTLPTGKIWSGDLPEDSVKGDMGEGITKFLNSRPTSLNLNYSLSLGNGTTIKRADIPEDGKTSIKAEVVITLPIKLEVTKDVEFDVFALAKIPTDKDLFGRTEAPATNEQINDLLKRLTKLNIGIDYNNNLGVALGARVVLIADEKGESKIEKEFMLQQGKHTYNLELAGDEITQVMNAYPFCPQVYVELPKGTVALEREGGINLSLGVTAVTDINYTYDLKGGK